MRRRQHRSLRGTECIGALLVQVGVDVSLLVFFLFTDSFCWTSRERTNPLACGPHARYFISYTVLERDSNSVIHLFFCVFNNTPSLVLLRLNTGDVVVIAPSLESSLASRPGGRTLDHVHSSC